MKARYAFERERRESSSSVKDDDLTMRVSSKEIDFPYMFGEQSSTPPDDKIMVSEMEQAYSIGPPAHNNRNRNGFHQLPPRMPFYQASPEVINGYSMTYDSGSHPPSAWNDMVTRTLPHIAPQSVLGSLPS